MQENNEMYLADKKLFAYLRKLIQVIFSPVKVIQGTSPFSRIILLIPFVVVTSVLPFIVRFQFFRDNITSSLKELKVPSNVIDQAANNVIVYNFIVLPIVSLIILTFWSVIMFGIVRVMEGEGSLKQYFAVIGYTFAINFLYACFIIIQSYFTGKAQVDISLYSLLTPVIGDLHSFLTGFFKEIDPFKIWKYIIIFLGALYVGKLSKSKAFLLVLVLYLISGSVKGLGEVLTVVTSHLR